MTIKTIACVGLIALVAGCTTVEEGDNILDVANESEEFSTLVTAVVAANLTETLQNDGRFTVFAPTDAAFAELPPGTLDGLLLRENEEQLREILTYHVVPGVLTSGAIVGRNILVETVQGQTLAIDGREGVTVNGANITTLDVTATNGVIHVVDAVLLPQ